MSHRPVTDVTQQIEYRKRFFPVAGMGFPVSSQCTSIVDIISSRMDARLVPGEANDLSGDTGARDVRLEWSAFAPNKARQSLVLANVRNRKMLAVMSATT